MNELPESPPAGAAVQQQQPLQEEVSMPETEAVVPTPAKEPEVRRSTGSTKGAPPQKLTLLTRIYATVQELADAQEKTKVKAVKEEIILIFKELKAVMPVMKQDTPKDAEILQSLLLLVEKYLA